MNLLVDMGNTRLKWAVTKADQIVSGKIMVNHQLNRHDLVTTWKHLIAPQRLVIACVSNNELLELVLAVAVELWQHIEIIQVKSQAYAFGVHNAYQQPEKLGVDRWLALVAARHHYRGAACIADCGTAITVDLIDDEGRHQGGLISPGLMLMKQSLAQGTAALQLDASVYEDGLANFTEAAIYNGTLMAASGLIEQIMVKQKHSLQLILTGGDAELIARQLSCEAIIDPNLVLQGLAIVAESE